MAQKGSKASKSSTKHFFLTRKKEFIEVELKRETPKRREVLVKEGPNKGKVLIVHPQGVAWGNLYPRLFETATKPQDFFMFKGRIATRKNRNELSKIEQSMIPEIDKGYRFQPFTTQILDAINSNEPTLLTGGTGVGKTTHLEQIAARRDRPVMRVNFNGETRMSDFLGKMQVINNRTVWQDGFLPMAMKMDCDVILDELDSAPPEVLTLLHPVLEENSQLMLKENNGEVIKKHPGCRIFATANSIGSMKDRAGAYAGTNEMNEAFIDRWNVITVPNLNAKEELKIVKDKVGGLKHRWAKKIVEFAQNVRENRFNNEDQSFAFPGDNFSTRRVLAWAKKAALYRSPLEGAKHAWLHKLPASDHDVIIQLMEMHFGSGKRGKIGVDLLDYKGKAKREKGAKAKPSKISKPQREDEDEDEEDEDND